MTCDLGNAQSRHPGSRIGVESLILWLQDSQLVIVDLLHAADFRLSLWLPPNSRSRRSRSRRTCYTDIEGVVAIRLFGLRFQGLGYQLIDQRWFLCWHTLGTWWRRRLHHDLFAERRECIDPREGAWGLKGQSQPGATVLWSKATSVTEIIKLRYLAGLKFRILNSPVHPTTIDHRVPKETWGDEPRTSNQVQHR